MNFRILAASTAAALLALSANAQPQSPSGAASGGTPSSSQSYPPGSTATPSGHSPGQGAGTSGSATADFHRDGTPGAGHGASGGASAMGFSQMDKNGDGQISREEWNAMHGGSAAGASGSASRSAPEPSSHAPAQ